MAGTQKQKHEHQVKEPAAGREGARADSSEQARREVDDLVVRAQSALRAFEELDQEQVDRIVAKASIAALNQHLPLAQMAVEETGRGLVEDKATKNIFACEHVTNYLARQRTCLLYTSDAADE